MQPKIVTIGVYGFDKDSFFQALLNANVDTFCDIRMRRGMRGSLYAFVNSQSLQRQLNEMRIRYLHIKDLAPTQEIREKQKLQDKELGVAKRTRTGLAQSFIQAYEQECLSIYDSRMFLEQVGPEAKVISLFCVEREPSACHRSLVAMKLAQELHIPVEHIKPQ
jgi:uncharacterized protein (DUF488 family)